jgi:alkyldihydroxyacetonephosphate synthase
VPDVVLYPQTQDEVLSLIELAQQETLCLVPFGGGTNVSLALQCPRGGRRVVACVDMRRMGRVLWVNEEDGLAEVQAGVVGRQLQRQLARRGLTMGHEPDSIEFSTLGGWIATRASGMKRSKYGNIEDMVVGVRVATVQGLAWQGPVGMDTPMTAAHRRASQGLELKHLVLGSEGNLGIITSAVIRVWPLPACQEYGAALLPSLDAGLSLMRAVSRLPPSLRPASIRLVDNAQFRLGRVLHQGQREGGGGVLAAAGALAKPLVEAGQRWYLARQGLQKDRVVGLSMLFEGSRDEVGLQRTRVVRLIEEAGGVQCGAQAGKVGYELTFGIAYIRDFALSYHVVGESFEAFVPWSTLHDTLASVAARVTATHADVGAQGRPFLSSRVTQVYEEGVCVYWYLALYARGAADPCAVFRRLERVAREEVVKRGGSVSHHHGVGKAKAHLLKQHGLSPAAVELMHCVKRGMDPTNVFGIGNGVMAIEDDAQDDKTASEAGKSRAKAPVAEKGAGRDIGIGVSQCDGNVQPKLAACKAAAGLEV